MDGPLFDLKKLKQNEYCKKYQNSIFKLGVLINFAECDFPPDFKV